MYKILFVWLYLSRTTDIDPTFATIDILRLISLPCTHINSIYFRRFLYM